MRLRVPGFLVLSVFLGLPVWADNFEVNAGGGNWSNLATWTQNGVPASRYPGQLAGTIDIVSGTVASFYTVSVNVSLAEAVTLTTDCPSNTSTCIVAVPAGGLLKLTGGSTIGTDAKIQLSGGTIVNDGTLTIAATADFDLSAGTLTGSGSTGLAFHATTPGLLNVMGGTLDSHTINLSGKAIQGATWSINNTGRLHIQPNGIYDLQFGNISTNNAATAQVINDGTLNKSGVGVSHVDAPLNNNNLVDITNGGMVMGGDPTHNSATFQIASGLGLELRGTFTGTSSITGAGTVSIVGTPLVDNGAILNMVNVAMNGGWLQGPAVGTGIANISGTVTFNGGVWRQHVLVNMLTGSTFNYPGAAGAFIDDASVDINSGATMNLNPGAASLGVNNGGSIVNHGTLNLLGDVTITSDLANNPVIINANAVNKSTGTGSAFIHSAFNNTTGTVSVTSGVLKLMNGGVHAATWFAGTSGGIVFDGGVHQLTGGSLTGTGVYALAAGTLDVDVNLLVGGTTSFQLLGGTLTGNSVFNLQGPFLWTGGSMDNSSGNGQTVLQGNNSQISGTTMPVKLVGRSLSNTGTFTYNPTPGLELSIDSGGQFLNTGSFNIVGDAVINSDGLTTPKFVNGTGGAINKSTGAGSATFFPYFANNQTLNLSSGNILLKGGGQDLGTVNFGPSGTNRIIIEDSNFGIATTPAFNGTGILQVTGPSGVLNVVANMTVAKLELTGGATITGSATLTVANSMLWQHGSMTGSGATTIANTAVLDASAPSGPLTLNTRTLNNNGTFNWNGDLQNLQLTGGATFNNNNLFNALGNGTVGSETGTIANAGTFKKSGGTAGTTIGSPITNSGTISSEVSGQSLIIAAGGSQTGGGMLSTATGALIDFFGGTYSVPAGTSPFFGSGVFRVNGGTLAITGNTSVPNPAILVVETGGTLDVATSVTFQVFNQFQWKGGTLQGNGTTRVFGGFIGDVAQTILTDLHILTLAGSSFNYDADSVNFLFIGPFARLNVESGATMFITGNGTIDGISNGAVSVSGSLLKTGSGTATLDVALLVASGCTYGATGGVLQINAGGSGFSPCTIETSTSGIVQYSGGMMSIGAGSTVNGTGTIMLSGAGTMFHVDGTITFPNFIMTGGSLAGGGALTVGGGSWSGGTMQGAGSTTVGAGKTFTFLDSNPMTLGRDFINNGTLLMDGGFDLTGSATVTNAGTWTLGTFGNPVNCTGCTGAINNAAGAIFELPISNCEIYAPFNNDGTVRVGSVSSLAAALAFLGGGTHTGDFINHPNVSPALQAGIQFGGTHVFGPTSDLHSFGGVRFSGASTLNGTYDLSGSLFDAGSSTTFNTSTTARLGSALIHGDINGTGALLLTGNTNPSTWDAGTISGTGAFTVDANHSLDIRGTAMLDGRTLTNNGTLSLSGSLAAGLGGGTVNNLSGFRMQAVGSVTFGPAFTNQGSAQFMTGSVVFNGGYTQTAGTTELAGGTFSSPFTVNIDGGLVKGNGTITASVSNDGTFAPGASAGTITVDGDFTQSPTGIIDAQIGGTTPGTQYDQLIITGNAVLDGTINVATVAYTPVDGDTFDLLTWASHSGTFATVNLPAFPAGTLTESYETNAFRITADAVGDVGVTKTGPANAPVGSTVAFTVTVENFGPADATGVSVADPTPANLSFVSNSGDCTTAFPCNLGTIVANATKTITSTYTVTGGSGTSVTNTATVSSTSTDDVSTNNSASAIVFIDHADVTISKTGPANAAVGSNVSFTIQVSNHGPSAADSVTVSDPTPANLTFSSNSGDCTTAFPCNIGTLAAGATKTITATYTVTGGTGTNVTNTATVSTTSSDNVPANDSASATVFIDYADLSITKIGPASAGVGGNVTFTIQVKNVGPSSADNVVVTDPTPANLTFSSNSGDCTTAFPCHLGTLTSGETKTITAVYAVTGGAGGSITNTATVSASSADNVGTNDSASATVNIDNADVAVTKTGPASAAVGSNVSFTIVVENAGASDAANVTVADPTPADMTFVSTSGDCTTAFPCSLGTLTSGQTRTITATYTVTGGAGGSITNTATVSTSTPDNVSTNDSSSATVNIDNADLAVSKTGPASAAVGSNVAFTIVVENAGASDAANVTVADPTPANMTFVSTSGDCTTAFPCSLGTLTSGQTKTITATYTVTGGAGTSITNTATVSTSTPDNVSTNDSSSATVNIDNADLAVTKTGPASAAVGSSVAFTIVVENAGASDAANVTVADPTPANMTFVSTSGDCTTAFPCTLGTLTSGQTKTITATYTVTGGAGTSITNTATVSTSTPDNVSTNDSSSATVFVELADLTISKTGPANAAAGSNVSFTIVVKNFGPSSANAVTVDDPTPANMTFVSTSGDCTTAFPCALGTMAAGQTRTITATYTVTGGAGSDLTNVATVSTTSSETNTNNNTASAMVAIDDSDVAVTKTGPASANVGSNVSFSILVKNLGPSQADNVVVADPTPANMIFVSNSGACAGPFPCSVGTLASGQSKVITATYTVTGGAGTSITNTATVSTTSGDNSTANNSASATVLVDLADLALTKTGPVRADAGADITFTITVVNGGASDAQNVVVTDPTPAGLNFLSNSGACTTAFPCHLGTVPAGATLVITSKYSVSLAADGAITNTATVSTTTSDDPSNNSDSAEVAIRCLNAAPENLTPAGTASGSGTLSWTGMGSSYIVYLGKAGSGCTTQFATTTAKSVPYSGLEPGTYEWRVESLSGGCRTFSSACVTFTVPNDCVVPEAPVASVVGQTTSAKSYEVIWNAVPGATSYIVEEATNPQFNGAIRIPVTGVSHAFKHDVTTATAFYYRVFAIAACTPAPSAPSTTIRVVIVPLPPKEQKNPSATVPAGTEEVIVQQVFIPGEAGQNLFFSATTDRPWLTVRPEQGVLPPAGINLDVIADPKTLPNGTFTASVIVTVTTNDGRTGTDGTTTVTTPFSVNLVTPVTPVAAKPTTSQYALIIPSAGHLGGIDSQWQSDIRVTNAGFRSARYRLTFTPSGGTSQGVKQTTITVDAGATIALDDIVKNWFGLGTLGDGVNGMLEILPLDDAATTSQTTVASSRTYNVTGNGTLGQYIPAVPFPSFIGRALPGAVPQVLSLQQIAQNSAYRTNVGLAEAGGAPVNAVISVFNSSGTKLTDIPVSLAAGEQRQMNQLLASHGIELADGRIEVKVTGGDGKVTAYASVVDSGTQDPLLVSGQQLGGTGSTKYVIAGVANLDNALAHWRTDMRVFNYGTSSQPATLTFFPFNNGQSRTAQVLLGAGQVMTLDNILKTQFGVENQGGVVHLATPNTSSLVVTGRTYNQTDNGTFGQFIPAVTAEQAVGAHGRTLHILQVEDSTRYRTNVGVAEVTGKPAIVELQVVLPDSKIVPTVQIPLAANEFRQFNVIRELGVGNVYNARITVRVLSGEGRVTAYGSVIDELTQDPTYVPAQ